MVWGYNLDGSSISLAFFSHSPTRADGFLQEKLGPRHPEFSRPSDPTSDGQRCLEPISPGAASRVLIQLLRRFFSASPASAPNLGFLQEKLGPRHLEFSRPSDPTSDGQRCLKPISPGAASRVLIQLLRRFFSASPASAPNLGKQIYTQLPASPFSKKKRGGFSPLVLAPDPGLDVPPAPKRLRRLHPRLPLLFLPLPRRRGVLAGFRRIRGGAGGVTAPPAFGAAPRLAPTGGRPRPRRGPRGPRRSPPQCLPLGAVSSRRSPCPEPQETLARSARGPDCVASFPRRRVDSLSAAAAAPQPGVRICVFPQHIRTRKEMLQWTYLRLEFLHLNATQRF